MEVPYKNFQQNKIKKAEDKKRNFFKRKAKIV